MMNSNQHVDDHLSDPAFQSVLVSCLEQLERGESLDRGEIIKANPDHADALDAFLADQAMLKSVARQVRDSVSGQHPSSRAGRHVDETVDSNPRRNGTSVGDHIRYVGEYEILEEIARGGMGVVFKARQQKLNRIVALKMILSGQLADEADVERFRREAQAAGQLRHPNIVGVHEIGEHAGHHYFTMDYIEGESLADRLKDESLSPREAAILLKTLAEAVHVAHEQGTLHRDLKPANILIDSNGVPHITDFGLAKVVAPSNDDSRAELTTSGQILGTPSYMSPEQASGNHAVMGAATDFYSLGAILFACLTGRAPFVADTPVDTILRVVGDEPLAPRLLNPKVPRDLNTICLKCLSKSPSARYASAADLAADLERFLAGEPIVARPVGPLARCGKWAWKRRKVLTVAAVAMVLGTFAAYGGWIGWRAYQRWQSGYLMLQTTSSRVVAEIINDAEDLTIQRFAIPTPEPVPLLAGEYQMRLAAPGRWNEEYRLTVHRGRRDEYVVAPEQQTWPPVRVDAGEYVSACRLDGHDDLLLLHPSGIRRLDGKTQELVWKTNLEKGDYPELDAIPYFTWRSAMNLGSSNVDQPPRPVDSPADVNGDGADDLIIVAADSGVAIALSGANGELLWVWSPQLRKLQEGERRRTLGFRRLVGMPAVADIDDDQVPDFVFQYVLESRWNYIEAVSGASGDSLWNRELHEGASDQDIRPGKNYFRSAHWLGQAKIAESSNGRNVVCTYRNQFETQCLGLDLASGETRWQRKIPMHLLRAPEFVDVDGDQAKEVIFVDHKHLQVWDQADGKRRCIVPLSGPWTENVEFEEAPELRDGGAIYEYGEQFQAWDIPAARLRAIIDDVDGDGRAEIVLPGPRLVSATDGKTIWDQGAKLASDDLLVQRYMVGPDVDGDGILDIATARLQYVPYTSGAKLIVAAFSGATGDAIWTADYKVHEILPAKQDATPLGAPLWGPHAADGLPLLLIPCRIKPAGATHHSITAFGFSLRTGRLIHEIEGIADPRVADFNGDGLADLFWFTPHPASGKYLPSGALNAISGRSPVIWQRPEILQTVGDLNDDGSTDLASLYRRRDRNSSYPGPVVTVRGSTGRKLWQADRDFHEMLSGKFFSSHGSVDSGTAKITTLLGRGVHNKKLHPVALSKSDGRELWIASDLGGEVADASIQVDEVRYTDLDRDGQTEVIIGFFGGGRDIGIAVLDTTDGTPWWSEVWAPPGSGMRTSAARVVGVAPLDNDDTDDLLLLHSHEGLRHYRAYSAADGQLLWERTFPDRVLHELFTQMNPIADLDGDGNVEVLVIDDQVFALDGQTGEAQWNWVWPDRQKSKRGERRAGEDTVPIYDVSGIPALADVDGAGALSVCFIANNHLVVLDGAGQLHQRTALDGHSPNRELSPGRIWVLDADDDGANELIFVRAVPPNGYSRHTDSDEHICCYGNGGQDLIWQWAMPTGFGQIIQTLPATDTHPATVVVSSGNSVYGISSVTGNPIWRCDGEQWWGSAAGRPNRYHYLVFGPRLLGEGQSGLPTIMFRQYQPDGRRVGTACHLALPTDSQGHYVTQF